MNGQPNEVRGLSSAVETVAPSVVRVDGRRRFPASGVVWSADGVVVSANHVVERDDSVQVGLGDGRALEAAVVGRDPSTDIAVLRVAVTDLNAPEWVGQEGLRVGDFVLGVAMPARSPEAALGVVSALGGSWRTGGGGVVEPYLRTDVLMYPGFSGGPLVDAAGRVLGVMSSALAPGASIAVPTVALRRIVGDLLAHGRIRRGYLGVTAQPVRLSEEVAASLGRRRGLLVAGVEASSPAAVAGVLIGDVLVGFGDDPLQRMDDLLVQLSGERVGASAVLRVLRGGEPIDLEVTIGERPRG